VAGDVRVVGEAGDALQALRMVDELEPNLVLMDLNMPGMTGVEATAELLKAHPDLLVVILTVQEADDVVRAAIAAGAAGYLAKSSSTEDIKLMFESLEPGSLYLTAAVAGRLVQSVLADPTGHASRGKSVLIDPITEREAEILGLLSRGLSARRIANDLSISERTVNSHIDHIYRKLGVNNRVEAVRRAVNLGLLDLTD
jgi:DNA-binding NarL/FixJ family response regulator